MDERRKFKRTSMLSKLVVKRLGSGEDQQVTIEITDVSKGGIGFKCEEQLQIGEMYEAFLVIWTKEVIHSILQIVRAESKEDTCYYGAVFVGMPDTELARIEVYQIIDDVSKDQ